jgi:thioredoxin-related protein
MRYILSLLLNVIALNTLAQSNDGIHFTHASWDEVKQLAKEHNRSIFIDCYTSWCGPCKMLSKNVFTQPTVGQLFNNHFINYKVDMEKGEGPALKNQYNVTAYPTLIWVDANGNELHKSVGAPSADELIQLANAVLEGKGLAALQRDYLASPQNYDLMLKYIEALANAYDRQTIQQVLNEYLSELKKRELLNETNYLLIKNYLDDIYSPAFIWFDKHQNDFKNRYPAKEVEDKLYRTYLSYGHSLTRKNQVDYNGFERYKKTLHKRSVSEQDKIIAYVQEGIFRAERNWDAYINKVNENLKMQYHEANNSFLYYNWAKSIDMADNATAEHHEQAALWMEKAFEVSTWPLQNNLVYLDEKLKLLVKAEANATRIEALKNRIDRLKVSVSQ